MEFCDIYLAMGYSTDRDGCVEEHYCTTTDLRVVVDEMITELLEQGGVRFPEKPYSVRFEHETGPGRYSCDHAFELLDELYFDEPVKGYHC